MKFAGILVLMCLMIFSIGCVSLQSVSLSQIPNKKGNTVQASAERLIVLGINFDNNYVDDVGMQMRSRCPRGTVAGILTKDEVVNYFAMLVYRRRITATGYCIEGK